MVVGDVVQNKGGGKMVISFQVKSKGIHFVLHKGDFIIFSRWSNWHLAELQLRTVAVTENESGLNSCLVYNSSLFSPPPGAFSSLICGVQFCTFSPFIFPLNPFRRPLTHDTTSLIKVMLPGSALRFLGG